MCEYGLTSQFAHRWAPFLSGEPALVAPYAEFPLELVTITATL